MLSRERRGRRRGKCFTFAPGFSHFQFTVCVICSFIKFQIIFIAHNMYNVCSACDVCSVWGDACLLLVCAYGFGCVVYV